MPSQALLFDVLKRFADTLANRFDVADVLYGLSDHAVEILGATAAGVSLAGPDGVLMFVSANSERAGRLEMAQQETREGPCHEAFRTGAPLAVADVAGSLTWPEYREAAMSVGLYAVLAIPLVAGGRCLGALDVYDERREEWSPLDIDAAEVLANMATSYIIHASELDDVQRANAQLQEALTSRILIEQAKGILAGEHGTGLDVGFDTLRRHARNNRSSLRSVADAVVNLGLRPPQATPASDTSITSTDN